ncbi:hypothetical protein [Actinacidiphila glaucinigra]|uniref:hypothetical protein n=1 Tax=Actinacidiphila glaucinigra TaxID=235986 RepID=UPI00371C1932
MSSVVAAEPRRRGSLIAFLLGLAFVATVHVIACAIHAPDLTHPRQASASQHPSSALLGDCSDDAPHGHHHSDDFPGCYSPEEYVCDAPARPQSLLLLLLGLAGLAGAKHHTLAVHLGRVTSLFALPPPLSGPALLRLACVSRT